MKIYAVGGSVRDMLMGVDSNDKDYVVVGATESDMLQLGYSKVGADFPVFINDKGEQFALARKERKTGHGYHGFVAEFDPSVTLEDDLYRRDLTINAIAQDLDTGEIVDPYNGRLDIQNRVLRHVGPAFVEDPLRVVRLARFLACIGGGTFTIAPETHQLAIRISESGELNHLTAERVWEELSKAIERAPNCWRFFFALGVTSALHRLKILTDALGNIELTPLVTAANAVKRLNPDERVAAFIALAAKSPIQESSIIPTRVKKLTAVVAKLRRSRFSAEHIHELIHFTRGFGSTDVAHELIRIMAAAESVGYQFPVEAQVLATCLTAARSVSSEEYQHLSGPEIGRAMTAARIEKIRNIVGA